MHIQSFYRHLSTAAQCLFSSWKDGHDDGDEEEDEEEGYEEDEEEWEGGHGETWEEGEMKEVKEEKSDSEYVGKERGFVLFLCFVVEKGFAVLCLTVSFHSIILLRYFKYPCLFFVRV
jgi:hypothetical protein